MTNLTKEKWVEKWEKYVEAEVARRGLSDDFSYDQLVYIPIDFIRTTREEAKEEGRKEADEVIIAFRHDLKHAKSELIDGLIEWDKQNYGSELYHHNLIHHLKSLK